VPCLGLPALFFTIPPRNSLRMFYRAVHARGQGTPWRTEQGHWLGKFVCISKSRLGIRKGDTFLALIAKSRSFVCSDRISNLSDEHRKRLCNSF
jgi:hypothetical protein